MPVKMTKDNVSVVLRSIQKLASQEVLIGIPATTTERQDDQAVNNATIGYIQETGSPAQNIPARPHLVPGVEEALPEATDQLKKGASAALSGNQAAADKSLQAAGLIGQNKVRAKVNSGIEPALSPSTIRNRFRQRGTLGRRKSEEKYLDLIDSGAQAAGMSLSEIQSQAGIISLVNTGQYRNSITYVVRKK